MTPVRLRKVLLRRWYLVAIGVFGTLALAFAASLAAPATFEAKSSILLLPPTSPNLLPNPYLGLAGYQPFADVVSRAMMDASQVDKLRAAGISDDYTVDRDQTTSGPVLEVTVDGSSASRVVHEVRAVVQAIPAVLTALQQGASVPTKAMFGFKVITSADRAEAIRKSEIRAVVAATGAGLVITLLLTVWIDSLGSKGDRRRRDTSSPGPIGTDDLGIGTVRRLGVGAVTPSNGAGRVPLTAGARARGAARPARRSGA